MQYGVRTKDGKVHTEGHWLTVTEVLKGAHNHGIRHISEWGELVAWDVRSAEWKKVHGSSLPD